MLKRILILTVTTSLVLSHSAIDTSDSTLEAFFNAETIKVNSFLQNQINRVKQIVKSSYIGIEAEKIRNNVDCYFDQQTKKLAQDVNDYVERLKVSGKKVADIWASFLPTEDPSSRFDNPDMHLSVPAIIARNGYECETHTIISQGYILNIHRIPRPKNGKGVSKGTVILQHGLYDSSFNWIINGPEKSLGYVLADAGFDVWMPNTRGNIHVREHAWYKTNSKEFWNFSFHETAMYDMPATIDYIQNLKGKDTKIAYLGHSMGTTILFSMLSLRPEYNEKLSVGIALAPAVFMSNIESPVKSVSRYVSNIIKTAVWFHSYEMLHRDFLDGMSRSCKSELGNMVCNNIISYIVGKDDDQLNKTVLNNYLTKGSATSWKTVLHMIQMINTGTFRQFDYGYDEYNKRVYGTETPPEYDLNNVKLNITLFWAQNDLLSSEKDVILLHEKLQNNTKMYLVPFSKFNHVDYVWARDAPRLVNDKVLEILKESVKAENEKLKVIGL